MNDKTNRNLKEAGLKATLPRIKILEILQRTSGTDDHFTAEDIYAEVNKKKIKISLATIYNCLNQFKEFGIIKAIKVSSDKIFFDTNLKEHHHFFCVKSAKLIDVETNKVKISKLPKIPRGKKLKSVDVIINISD